MMNEGANFIGIEALDDNLKTRELKSREKNEKNHF